MISYHDHSLFICQVCVVEIIFLTGWFILYSEMTMNDQLYAVEMFVVETDPSQAAGVSSSQPDLIQSRATPPHPSLEPPFPLNEASEASGLADSHINAGVAAAATFSDVDLQFENVFGAQRVCDIFELTEFWGKQFDDLL